MAIAVPLSPAHQRSDLAALEVHDTNGIISLRPDVRENPAAEGKVPRRLSGKRTESAMYAVWPVIAMP